MKHGLETTRAQADTAAAAIVPRSTRLPGKRATLQTTRQSLEVFGLGSQATRAGEPASSAIARSVELARHAEQLGYKTLLGGRTSLHSGIGLLSHAGTHRTCCRRDKNYSSGQRWGDEFTAAVLDAETFLNETTQPGSMFEPAYSKGGSEFFCFVEDGRMAYVGTVRDDTKKILGREPLLLREWAKLHANELFGDCG